MTIADRGERGGQHHPLDACVARGAQHPQRTFARGHDQLVVMLGHADGKRRGNVQHVLAAGGGFLPAGIVLQIGGEEVHRLAGLGAAGLEHGANVGLTL